MNLLKYINKGWRIICSKFQRVKKLWKCNKNISKDFHQSSTINDIDSLDKLTIQAYSKNASPKIYSNGKNQVAIEIIVKASDQDGRVICLPDSEWIEGLSICFAESDKKLNRNGENGWCFTEKDNGYCREIEMEFREENRCSATVKDDGTTIIILYVYTNVIDKRRIAVCFDTAQKHFTTSDNPSDNTPKMSVLVEAVLPINYSNIQNTDIIPRDFSDIHSRLGWTSRLTTEGPYLGHNNGTCKRRIVEIHPAAHTGQRNFKEHKIHYFGIRNKDANKGQIVWAYHSGNYVDCFEVLKSESSLPCAVIGRGYNSNHYETNLWFSRKKYIDIDGPFFLCDRDYYYRFAAYVNEQHSNDDEQGIPSLLLYKFSLPARGLWQYYWTDVINHPIVEVTDHYGNEGKIELIFNDSDHFDVPGRV